MKKIALIFLTLCIFIFGAFAQTSSDAESGFNTFIKDLADTLPDNAVSTGTWSDAYIGQLLNLPPHLGVGVSAAATKLSVKGLNDAAEALGRAPLFSKDELFLPAFSLDARLGGILLPFDIGGKAARINNGQLRMGDTEIGVTYQMWGADIRLPIVEENKNGKGWKPDLIIGFGYTFLEGSLSADMGVSVSPAFGDGSRNSMFITTFQTSVYSGTVQLSKKILFLTPYIGTKVLYSQENTGWSYGHKSGSENREYHFSTQIFGGLSLDIFVLKLSAGASYNFSTGNIGAAANIRIQL